MRRPRGEKELGMLQKLSEWLECQEAGDGLGVEIAAKWDWKGLTQSKSYNKLRH